ncbi:hypothetical protein [Bradyrhizobium sp. LA2.1]|uniref:hypothetical protein n=1 Tax=Bradyrhizobium sp. LA2.1 TaxID=3156376 RepID=UPI0033972330
MPTRSSILCSPCAVLIVAGLVLFSWGTAAAQPNSDTPQQSKGASLQLRSLQHRKARLEVERLRLELNKLKQELDGDLPQRKAKFEVSKLELEAKKLEREAKKIDDELRWSSKWGPPLLTTITSLFVGILGGWIAARAAMWVAHRNALAEMAAATHEKRLECYPELVEHTLPLAIYFPMQPLDPRTCEEIGRAISGWYFVSGLLLSAEARDAYFLLARALTRASDVKELLVPQSTDDAKKISPKIVQDYRDRFNIVKPDNGTIENWKFGVRDEKLKPDDYKDYVLLQTLGSWLRTMLTEDIGSRRRPSEKPPSSSLAS